ncbi:MAG TPA: formate dehydrogenase subunit delta [Steroidobacteraceae bacterium]|nr:formate dehydrogenase subunit delta [Steroidobacteraceae bacterium]
MNIDLLIKMANEIGEFFAGADASDPQAAARDVANHITRYWEPRMRAQMLKYYEERNGAGLSDLGKSAVALLYAASRASAAAKPVPATAGTAPAAATPAPTPSTAAPGKGSGA